MMLAPVLRVALPVALAGTFGLQTAHADIYTWVDASGSINVSNLAPPDDARVIRVMHESAPAAGDDAARLAQALAERVKQLEREVELSKRALPPPPDYAPNYAPNYAPIPAAPTVQYTVQYIVQAPAPPEQYQQYQYAASEYPPANSWCDPNLLSCGLGWNPGFYPSGVVVLQQPNFRRVRPSPNGRNPSPHAAPVLPPLIHPVVPQLATQLVPPMALPPRQPAGFHKG